jgi:hypothetical protein
MQKGPYLIVFIVLAAKFHCVKKTRPLPGIKSIALQRRMFQRAPLGATNAAEKTAISPLP